LGSLSTIGGNNSKGKWYVGGLEGVAPVPFKAEQWRGGALVVLKDQGGLYFGIEGYIGGKKNFGGEKVWLPSSPTKEKQKQTERGRKIIYERGEVQTKKSTQQCLKKNQRKRCFKKRKPPTGEMQND